MKTGFPKRESCFFIPARIINNMFTNKADSSYIILVAKTPFYTLIFHKSSERISP